MIHGLAECLLGREPGRQALEANGGAGGQGVGELAGREQAFQSPLPPPEGKVPDPRHLHQVDPYVGHGTIRARSAATIASTRATAAARSSLTTR